MSLNRIVKEDGLPPRRIPRTIEDIKDWFWTHVTKDANGCWLWRGPTQVYGVCRVNGKKHRAFHEECEKDTQPSSAAGEMLEPQASDDIGSPPIT